MTEREVLREFYNLQTCSPRRQQKIKLFINKAREIIKKDLTKLKLTDITLLLRELNQSDYALWTKNDFKKIFKSFLKWKYKKEFLEWNDDKNFREGFKGVSKSKAINRRKINKNTLIKPEELEILLRASKSLKWKALLTLLYESAFRPCEIVNLRWSDLNFDDARNICSVKTTSPKTKNFREIPVQDCIVHLKRWREEFEFPNRTDIDFVFPNDKNREKHLSENSIPILLKRLCRRAGIRSIYPYLFRHSRIYFIQKKLGSRISSKYAGHSLETSEIYDHLDCDDVEEAMLENVYTTKELNPQQKQDYEKKLKELKNQILEIQKAAENLNEIEIKNKKSFEKRLKELEARIQSSPNSK